MAEAKTKTDKSMMKVRMDGTETEQRFRAATDRFEQRVLAVRLGAFFALQAIAALMLVGAYIYGKLAGVDINGGFEILVGGVGTYLFGLYNRDKKQER